MSKCAIVPKLSAANGAGNGTLAQQTSTQLAFMKVDLRKITVCAEELRFAGIQQTSKLTAPLSGRIHFGRQNSFWPPRFPLLF